LFIGLPVVITLRSHNVYEHEPVPQSRYSIQFEKAAKVIAQREHWPDSPEEVAKAFWDARNRKDYAEMEVLWPGSAAAGWPELCKDERPTRYVFGSGKKDEEAYLVPYDTDEYFRRHGRYRSEMRLQALKTPSGRRWYVVSAN
jgi:hypothetical protein